MTEENRSFFPDITQSWGILGIVVLFSLLFGLFNTVLQNFINKDLSFFIYYVLAFGLSFWYIHKLREKKNGASSYNLMSSNWKVIFLVSIGTIAFQIGVTMPIIDLIPMPDSIEELFRQLSEDGGVFMLIAAVIAAPILEELIFRGIILDGLLKRYSPIKSILFSSLLFGIVHFNPWQFISAMVIGMFSGWMYYKTRNLTLSILIHFVNNLFATIMGYFQESYTLMDQPLLEIFGGFQNYLLIVLGGVAVGLGCLHFLRKEFQQSYIDPGEFTA